MSVCECCGYSAEKKDPAQVARMLRLSPKERALYDALARRFGRWTSWQDLASVVYADDPNGGPDDAENSINVAIHYLKKKIAARGLVIDATFGSGGGRRMVWRTVQ